jgi:hypothetical protein
VGEPWTEAAEGRRSTLSHGARPIPGVGEGVELRLAGLAGRLAEQDVVIRIGIERRVEIDEVNAGVGKKLRVAQPVEIVAEQEAVHKTNYQKLFLSSIKQVS